MQIEPKSLKAQIVSREVKALVPKPLEKFKISLFSWLHY